MKAWIVAATFTPILLGWAGWRFRWLYDENVRPWWVRVWQWVYPTLLSLSLIAPEALARLQDSQLHATATSPASQAAWFAFLTSATLLMLSGVWSWAFDQVRDEIC